MDKYKVPPKIEKHLRKNKKAWSRKGLVAILTYTIVVILTSLFVKSMWDGYWRTHSWKFQSPVIFQTPVIIKEVKPQAQKALSPVVEEKLPLKAEIKPYSTEVEYLQTKPHVKILTKIYERESNSGAKDVCRSSGKGFNGLGLGESDDYIREHGANCFPSYEALWDRAERLITDLGYDKRPSTAVCRWKHGDKFNEPDCIYNQEVMSL